MNIIDAARVRELLTYDPESGIFRWRAKHARHVVVGKVAGSNHNAGYETIRLQGTSFLAHRLAWVYVHGEMPEVEIDHIDGNRRNNSIPNLRLATPSQNRMNRGPNKTKPGRKKGAFFNPRDGYWFSSIGINGRSHYLGSFATQAEAHAAYVEAATRLHGEFARSA